MLLEKDFVMQGGVRNYLGTTEEVTAPKFWKSSKDSPKTELAYITEAEKGLLIDANLHGSLKDGKPNVGASGLLSYDGWGDVSNGVSDTSASNAGAEGGQGSGSSGNTGYQGGNNNYTTPDPQLPPGVIDKGNNTGDGEDIDSIYTDDSFNVTPEPVEKNFFEKVVDFVKGGGIIGSVIKSIGGKLNPENKYKGITGEDGIGEGDYISTQGDWAASKGFVDKPEDYYELDLEEQQDIDKQMYDDGVRSQAFNDLYNDGDTSNLNNLTTTERNEINKIIPNLPDAIGGTTPQPSMVNQYFNNLGNNNLGMSSAYLTTYNDAKNKIAQTLNLTPNTQQFGFGNTFNNNYARSMTTANPFFEELTDQGLI